MFILVLLHLLVGRISTTSVYDSRFGEVKFFEDLNNWSEGRLPCKTDRIILQEGSNVYINSRVQLKELVLPMDGAVIFGENAVLDFFEGSHDTSCPGEDMFFGVYSNRVSSFGSILSRLLLDVLIVAVLVMVVGGVYLNRTRGYGVWDSISFFQTQVGNRLSSFYVTRPPEGIFNFVRFQGDDDNLHLEMGSQGQEQQPCCQNDNDTENEPTPPVRGKSLRNIGFKMSEIKESDQVMVETQEEPDLMSMDDES